ncbi:MAG: ExbD/TolR family protein [Pyrinomonadaceae bacterium]
MNTYSNLVCASAIAFAVVLGCKSSSSKDTSIDELVELPVSIGPIDENLYAKESMIVTLTNENKLFREHYSPDSKVRSSETFISKEELPKLLKDHFAQGISADKQKVYFKADADAAYENVLSVFEGIQKADIEKIALVINQPQLTTKNNPNRGVLLVKVPTHPSGVEEIVLFSPTITSTDQKPNPLSLVVVLDAKGRVSLNMMNFSDYDALEKQLSEVFEMRKGSGVVNESTGEVETTVILKVAKSCKYNQLVTLVEAVKSAGGSPIVVHMANLE